MGGVSPGEVAQGTSSLVLYLIFRDISAQMYFIAAADKAHPSINFLGLLHPMLPQTQCGRVWSGRKWRPWQGERKEPQAGSWGRGVQAGHIKLDGDRDGL